MTTIMQSLMALRASYPRWEATQAAIEVWQGDLEHYPVEQVDQVLTQWRRTKTWPPSLAEILQRLNGIDSVEDAWAEVVACLAKESASGFKKFHGSKAAKMAAYAIWPDGWLPADALKQRRDFDKAYETAVAKMLAAPQELPALGEGSMPLTTGIVKRVDA